VYTKPAHSIRGQTFPIFVILLALLLAFCFSNFERMNTVLQKMQYQRKTDALALSVTNEYVQALNAIAAVNLGIEQLYKEMTFYNVFLVTATALVASSCALTAGTTCKYIKELRALKKGKTKLKHALVLVGKQMDMQLDYFEKNMFGDMCIKLKRLNHELIMDFIKDNSHHRFDLGLKDLAEFAKQKRWITIEPNICDPAFNRHLPVFQRAPIRPKKTLTCKDHTFKQWRHFMRQAKQLTKHDLFEIEAIYTSDEEHIKKINITSLDPLNKLKKSISFINTLDQRYLDFNFKSAQLQTCKHSQKLNIRSKKNAYAKPALLDTQKFKEFKYFTITTHMPFVFRNPFKNFNIKNATQTLPLFANKNIKWMTNASHVRIDGIHHMLMTFGNDLVDLETMPNRGAQQ